jgi:hypothetical protein
VTLSTGEQEKLNDMAEHGQKHFSCRKLLFLARKTYFLLCKIRPEILTYIAGLLFLRIIRQASSSPKTASLLN